jgi:hypothetical protein
MKLTREQIEEWRTEMLDDYAGAEAAEVNALCDMALASLGVESQSVALLRAWVAGCGDEHFSTKDQCRDLLERSSRLLASLPYAVQRQPVEPFVVRFYVGDPFPTIKGNGFDGLAFHEPREEVEDFVKWLNSRLCEEEQSK